MWRKRYWRGGELERVYVCVRERQRDRESERELRVRMIYFITFDEDAFKTFIQILQSD